MKKMLAAVVLVACVATVARADFYEFTTTVSTNAAVLSDALPIAGVLDRVEVIQTAGVTNTVILATYSGTTAVDTFVSLTDLTGNKVIRPRIIGTTTAGVDLAAAANGTNDYTAGTVLIAPFEKPKMAGNIKVSLTANAANAATVSTVTLRLYFERPRR